ncbi:facilitated trehalose transporter Tret1-like isoform X2 [Cherax quadricarinatus]|uniref:facilitated trehalose transporter Tret1-like isoform X2 n=1 Tax=Cherax quadricarinatus TaxID=27406 RepID=UPI00237866D1|nr:facilitated trehalose transporter Tret1-like isoform X2 [Cherax quadricarinatus]
MSSTTHECVDLNHIGGECVAPVTEDRRLVGSTKEPADERRARLTKQIGLVIMGSMGHFSLGATLTWPSPALSDMATNNATLVGTQMVLSTAEMDMTGSLVSLGSLLGSWVCGWIVTRLGRLRALQMIIVPFLLGWLANAFAPNPLVLLIARFVLGMACGASSVAGTLYVIELADASVRGMMASIPTLGIVLGGLYTVGLGYVLEWHYLALVCSLPPIMFFVCTFCLPDSPSFLVVKGSPEKALKILRKLRGPYADIGSEVADLEKRNQATSGGWRALLKRYIVMRMAVIDILFFLQQFCGNYVFMVHTSRVLQASGVRWDPDMVTVIVGVVRVLGTLVAFVLIDRTGRRYCLVLSHAINSSALVILGIYVHLAEASQSEDDTYSRLSWIPLTCVLVVMFAINMGAHPVPFILCAEYFPTNIRGQASSLCYIFGTVFAFMGLQLYSPMQETLSQAGLYWFYSAISCLGVIFTFLVVEETSRKAVG